MFQLASIINFTGTIQWDLSKPDGPLKRNVSDARFRKLMPSFVATPLSAGLAHTVSAVDLDNMKR
jgi:hypothetical protein